MHGLPVVATATSGLDEVVDDSCGLKVPLAVSADRVEIDADQLAEKILFLLRNPEEARQLGRNGRGRFVERYSSEVFGRNMSAFYESLFAEENPTEEAMEKEKHIDLSVIVPIYNTEAYLPVCLDSLLGIDGPCVEIVLVDDGSTDGSGKIADAYALEDSRIRVIHQANGGASVARNTGLEVARGEYILFVDSDDWVLGDALASLFRTGVESQADVVMGKSGSAIRRGIRGRFSIRSRGCDESLAGQGRLCRVDEGWLLSSYSCPFCLSAGFLAHDRGAFRGGDHARG